MGQVSDILGHLILSIEYFEYHLHIWTSYI